MSGQKCDWNSAEVELPSPPAGVDGFAVNPVNYGIAGKMWVDNLKVSVENDAGTKLLRQDIDFNNSEWESVVTRQWGAYPVVVFRNTIDSCLELPPWNCMKTPLFPYGGGKITVGCDIIV